MTNKDLCEFLVARANGRSREHGPKNGKLVVINNNVNLYLGIKFENYVTPYFVRFIQNNVHGVFKLTAIGNPAFDAFKSKLIADMKAAKTTYEFYDYLDIPRSVKNKISATLVQAFKTKDMGIDILNPQYGSFITIVQPDETYEEIAIEHDLNFMANCDLSSL